MIDFLFRLPNLITLANPVTEPTIEGLGGSGSIGLFIIAIIITPLIVLAIPSMFETPRRIRVQGLFIGSLVLVVGAIIFFMAIFGTLLGFIIPQ